MKYVVKQAATCSHRRFGNGLALLAQQNNEYNNNLGAPRRNICSILPRQADLLQLL